MTYYLEVLLVEPNLATTADSTYNNTLIEAHLLQTFNWTLLYQLWRMSIKDLGVKFVVVATFCLCSI